MKPSDKQLSAGVKAFNECDVVSTPHCISAAYDAMTEVMTVVGVPERVRREIENLILINMSRTLHENGYNLAGCKVKEVADEIMEGK